MKQVFKRTINTYKYDAIIMNEDRTTHRELFYFSRKFKSEKAVVSAINSKLPDNVRCLTADFVEEAKTVRCMSLEAFLAHSYVEGTLDVQPGGACEEAADETDN